IDNTFIQGLITDHTALNFPENACTDCNNVIFEPTGRVIRRRGFKYEDDYDTVTVDRTNKVIRSFLWKEVTGLGAINIFVIQIGATLYFYLATSGAISAARIQQTVDLSDYEVMDSDETLGSYYCEF